MFKRFHFQLDLRPLVLLLVITIVLPGMVFTKGNPDEALYRKLSNLAANQGEIRLFASLNDRARQLDWENADEIQFTLAFVKPRGIIIGQLLQFGLMPFLAMCLGHLLGFYKQYPFIFVGMILITAIPGGVTSNLMTYYAIGLVMYLAGLISIFLYKPLLPVQNRRVA